MMDNARPVPSSTTSRGTPLSQPFPAFLASLATSRKSVQNPYKSDHFLDMRFFIRSTSTTCNFNALKCTDFPWRNASPLHRGGGQTGLLGCVRSERGTSLEILYKSGRSRTISNSVRIPATPYQALTSTAVLIVRIRNPRTRIGSQLSTLNFHGGALFAKRLVKPFCLLFDILP